VKVVLSFVPPAEVASTNQAVANHWRWWHGRKVKWRNTAHAHAALWRSRNARAQFHVPVQVSVDLPFRDNRRRDPHNYVGTVVKAMVDGLVNAGLFPDDSGEWATIDMPTLNVGARVVTITIRPREDTPWPSP